MVNGVEAGEAGGDLQHACQVRSLTSTLKTTGLGSDACAVD